MKSDADLLRKTVLLSDIVGGHCSLGTSRCGNWQRTSRTRSRKINAQTIRWTSLHTAIIGPRRTLAVTVAPPRELRPKPVVA
jgi:hypothetical protein